MTISETPNAAYFLVFVMLIIFLVSISGVFVYDSFACICCKIHKYLTELQVVVCSKDFVKDNYLGIKIY